MLQISKTVQQTYPGACFGILALTGVESPSAHSLLDEMKLELEEQLRIRYGGLERSALKAVEPLSAYVAYYKRFKSTYHVQLQLESIVFKKKSIPRVSALVEAMFMAELRNLLLTAGHDLKLLELPLKLEVADGTERYIGIGGREHTATSGDMMLCDARGVVSSILHGPDDRTRIVPDTREALFFVYAPPGIDPGHVYRHLQDIARYVRIVAPGTQVTRKMILDAAGRPLDGCNL